jgi:hypothetical protein
LSLPVAVILLGLSRKMMTEIFLTTNGCNYVRLIFSSFRLTSLLRIAMKLLTDVPWNGTREKILETLHFTSLDNISTPSTPRLHEESDGQLI